MTQNHQHIRSLEILPGLMTWATFLGAPILSYFHPAAISIFIILFDLYWFLKGANVAIHLMHSHYELKSHNQVDWQDWLKRLQNPGQFQSYLEQSVATKKGSMKSFYHKQLENFKSLPGDQNFDWQRIYHAVILATVDEELSLLEQSIASYANADYDTSKIILVLATEDRAGEEAQKRARILEEKFSKSFGKFLITRHPDNIPGEVKGKGTNMNWAATILRQELKEREIAEENVILSTFDSDTVVAKNYFAHLTYDFLTVAKPLQTSYQPMPVYHNNIWDAPAVARVVATSSAFWQLIEASRPDRLITFASHAMSFKTFCEVGMFMKDSIDEDSFIFWQCFMRFNGDYRNKPLFTTVSMDAVMGPNLWQTIVAQYKQKRRWAYGVTQITYIIPNFLKNKMIPLWKRLLFAERFLEGHYFWATASIMIAILGWLPLHFGGSRFGNTVLALNLPVMTKIIMSVATFFLIFSVYINHMTLPKRPAGYGLWRSLSMMLQWTLSPIVASVFGSLPAIDAQTRVMLGKYMESFWVTPKFRKSDIRNQISEIRQT